MKLSIFAPRIICPPSQYLAEAVPENEGDNPFISLKSIIRNQSKGLGCGVGMVGTSVEKNLRDSLIYVLVVVAPYMRILICSILFSASSLRLLSILLGIRDELTNHDSTS